MKKSVIVIALAAAALSLLTGCIGVERKEYKFTIKPDGSGTGVIRFINLVSSDDNSKDVSFKDYAELVTDYVEGTKFEDDHPKLQVTGKKLKEENGVLVGEVSFTFTSLDSTGFFTFPTCACAPLMYFVKTQSGSETIEECNGKIVTDVIDSPFMLWDGMAGERTFTTRLLENTDNTHPLAPHHKTWEKQQKKSKK